MIIKRYNITILSTVYSDFICELKSNHIFKYIFLINENKITN